MTNEYCPRIWFATLGLMGALVGVASATSEGWVTDLAAAKQQAGEKKLDIFMNFTGSDWWGGCIQLEKRVFSKKEFVAAASQDFVLLEVDFPQGKKLEDALKQQNEGLSSAFKIQAFPTLMLCDARGRPYGEAGFPDEMTPEGMLGVLAEAKKSKATRDAAFAKAQGAEGVEKAKLLVEALGKVPQATVSGAYGETIDEIVKLDPEDETGYVKKAKAEKALSELETGFVELMEEGDFDGAIKAVDAFLAENELEGEAKQKAILFKLFAHANKEEFDKAIEVADELIKIDPETETAAMVEQLREQLERQ